MGKDRREGKSIKEAKIDAELSDDLSREIWEKFVFIVGLSATTSAMRLPIGPIRSNPQTRIFLRDVMNEAVVVARAHKIDLPVDYAEKRLAFFDSLPEDAIFDGH